MVELGNDQASVPIWLEGLDNIKYGWCYLSHRGPADYLLYVAQEPANYLLYAGLSAGRYPLLKNRTDLRLRAGHNGTLKQTLIWWSQC